MPDLLNSKYKVISGGIELLDMVKPLWEKLNSHHQKNSPHFKDAYGKNTFERRKTGLIKKSEDSDFYIEILYFENEPIGYCISSVSGDTGEIESIFIEEKFRGQKLGENLILNALSWIKKHNAASIIIYVAAGNEKAFDFYRKFHFFPSATRLMLKQ